MEKFFSLLTMSFEIQEWEWVSNSQRCMFWEEKDCGNEPAATKCKRDYGLAWWCWKHCKGCNKGICNWALVFFPSLKCIHEWGVIIFWESLHHGMRWFIFEFAVCHGTFKSVLQLWEQLDFSSVLHLFSGFQLYLSRVSYQYFLSGTFRAVQFIFVISNAG